MQVNRFTELDNTDLEVDHIYCGGAAGNSGDDPIARLLPGCGNMGGIRVAGRHERRRFIVLFTTGKDPDWTDRLDLSSGQLTYFGDNKDPDKDLHDPKGNQALRDCFRLLMQGDRDRIPPFFLFHSHPVSESKRSVRFGGLAVPGWADLPATESLPAVWQAKDGRYFQNYRAHLTIIVEKVVARAWLRTVIAGSADDELAPAAWKQWRTTGTYQPLRLAAGGDDA